MPRAPAVRVSAARDLLDFAERFEPGSRQKILDRFPITSREIFDASPRTSWLPIEHDHWVVDGLVNVLGRERAIHCWRDSVPDIVDKPLLRTFVGGMVRLFGRDPNRVFGLLPKAWPTIYQDFCTVRFEPGKAPGTASAYFEDVASQVAMYPNYFASWQGIVWGMTYIAQVRGSVELVVAKDCKTAEIRITWK